MAPIYLVQFYVYSLCIYLFTLFANFVYHSDLLISSYQSKLQPKYDYIIVGSGTAGSLIAHRLATETNYTFIVLEAGSRSHALLEIPVLGPLLHGSVHDWLFETVSQTDACLAMIDNKCKLTQGKIFGGSSKLNNMIYVRGNISHYAGWLSNIYNEEYIKKQMDFLENDILQLNDILYESHLTEPMLKAAEQLGYDRVGRDFKIGFMKSKLSQKYGKRWTISDMLDISKHVITNALVEKLLIENEVCVGVKLHKPVQKYEELYANKGVIISTGAFNSPRILQLSGIGPSELLRSLNISVVIDLPVGKNLQDHIGSGLDLVLFNDPISISPLVMLNPFNIYQYFSQGIGPFTSPGSEVIGFLSTKNNTTPDIEFMVLPLGISTDLGSKLKNSISIKDNVWENYFAHLFNKNTGTIFATILHPESRGEVYIKSKDPNEKPIIDPKYLSKKNDREVLVNALKLVKQFVETDAMKASGAYMNPLPFPGCEKYVMFSDSYWECYVKHLTLTSYHPVGTCSMGPPDSKNSVVDQNFKVKGVKSLYVADSSVLPSLPGGNINAAVALMASIFFESNIKPQLHTVIIRREGFCYIHNLLTKICDT